MAPPAFLPTIFIKISYLKLKAGRNSTAGIYMNVPMLRKVISPAPQVAETKTPYLMDAAGASLLYDESMVYIYLVYRNQGELDHEYRKT